MAYRFILGAGLLASSVAFAADEDEDFGLGSYLSDVLTESRTTRRDRAKDLKKELDELGKAVDRAEWEPIEKTLKKYQAEKFLVERIGAETPERLDAKVFESMTFSASQLTELDKPASGRDLAVIRQRQAQVQNDINSFKEELEELGKKKDVQPADIARKEELEKKVPQLEKEQTELKDELGSKKAVTVVKPVNKNERVQLVGQLRKNSEGKTELTFTARWNPAKRKDLPSEVLDHYSEAEIDAYMQSQLGEHFGGTVVLDEPLSQASIDKAMKKARESASVRSVSDALRAKIGDRKSRLGADGKENTLIGDTKKELDEKKGLGRKAKVSELAARKKLIEWLNTAGNDPTGKEPCDIFKAALGGWANFPESARTQCDKMNPDTVAANAAAGERNQNAATQDMSEQQRIFAQMYAEASVLCESRGQLQATQVASAKIVSDVTELTNYIERTSIKNCDSYVYLLGEMGKLTGEGDSLDVDPMADENAAAGVPPAKVAKVLELYPNTVDGTKQLNEQLACQKALRADILQKMKKAEGISTQAMQQIEMAMNAGRPLPLDPSLFNSTNAGVRRMHEFHKIAMALEMATLVEKNRRDMQNSGTNRFSGSSANPTGAPTPAGGGAPARVYDGAASGQVSGQMRQGGTKTNDVRRRPGGNSSGKPRYNRNR